MEKGKIIFMSCFFFFFFFCNWYLKFSLVNSMEWVHSPPSQIIAVSTIASETCKALTLVSSLVVLLPCSSCFQCFLCQKLASLPFIYLFLPFNMHIFLWSCLSVALCCKKNFQFIGKGYLDALQSPVLQPIIRYSWNFWGGNSGVMDFKNIF